MISATSGKSMKQIEFTTEAILGLVTRWYPYRIWTTCLTDGNQNSNDFWFICKECYAELNVN